MKKKKWEGALLNFFMPGRDTLKIERAAVFINNQAIQIKSPLKHRYQVTTDGAPITPRVVEKFGVEEPQMLSTDVFSFFLTPDQASAFKELKFVKNIEPRLANEGQPDQVFFKNSNTWNSDYFGPIYIPKKGDRIALTKPNIDLYISCIQHFY